MASYPKDRFDELPEDLVRVGAHRTPKKKGRGWIAFAWAALATFALIFGGTFVMTRFFDIDMGLSIFEPPAAPTPTPTPTPTADPITDPSTIDPARVLRIEVLNGTPIVGLQTTIADALRTEGWTIASALPSSAKDVNKTFVYYTDEADEDVARGLAIALGVGEIKLVSPETFPTAQITIVIGADYPVPTAPPAG
ncbi:hypothetical protein BH10ACT7_BH10ACT7_31180 [soil metagenome]